MNNIFDILQYIMIHNKVSVNIIKKTMKKFFYMSNIQTIDSLKLDIQI